MTNLSAYIAHSSHGCRKIVYAIVTFFKISPNGRNVSGQSKPAREGRMKTGHFEGEIASGATGVAQGRDERTQREPATFDFDLGRAWLVAPADCAGTGH